MNTVLVVAYGTNDITHATVAAQSAAVAPDSLMVLGITRLPRSNGWHVGVGCRSHRFRWVSVHRYKSEAERQIVRVARAIQSHDLEDTAKFGEMLEELAAQSDEELWARCEAAGRHVLESIWAAAEARTRLK